jgi:hypothetical protein
LPTSAVRARRSRKGGRAALSTIPKLGRRLAPRRRRGAANLCVEARGEGCAARLARRLPPLLRRRAASASRDGRLPAAGGGGSAGAALQFSPGKRWASAAPQSSTPRHAHAGLLEAQRIGRRRGGAGLARVHRRGGGGGGGAVGGGAANRARLPPRVGVHLGGRLALLALRLEDPCEAAAAFWSEGRSHAHGLRGSRGGQGARLTVPAHREPSPAAVRSQRGGAGRVGLCLKRPGRLHASAIRAEVRTATTAPPRHCFCRDCGAPRSQLQGHAQSGPAHGVDAPEVFPSYVVQRPPCPRGALPDARAGLRCH